MVTRDGAEDAHLLELCILVVVVVVVVVFSIFINRPSVLFWGGDVALVSYISIDIYVSWDQVRLSFFWSNFINRPSVICFFGDAALVHKYLHIRILGPGTSKLSCIYVVHKKYATLVRR